MSGPHNLMNAPQKQVLLLWLRSGRYWDCRRARSVSQAEEGRTSLELRGSNVMDFDCGASSEVSSMNRDHDVLGAREKPNSCGQVSVSVISTVAGPKKQVKRSP